MALSCRLGKVLRHTALEPQENGSIVLEEVDKNSRMKVELVNLSVSVTVIRLREFSHYSALKEGPWKKQCDYLLVFALDGIEYIVFVELKKSMNHYDKAKEQLRWSLPFLEYLRSVCNVAYGIEVAGPSVQMSHLNIVEKYSPRLDKQSVKVGPNRVLKCEQHENITVKTLIGPTVSLATLSRA